MMRRIALRVIGILLGALITNASAFAHGGVSIEFDKCVLKIGNYLMHFTGYQPEVAAGMEFCEDIPAVGNAIIVLDYIDAPLRNMKADFRIIGSDSWDDALSAAGDDKSETILHLPPKLYKTGSLMIEHVFPQPGYFVGLMTVEGENGKKLASRFPFSVGYGLGGNLVVQHICVCNHCFC
jgi:hypothetical protein